MNKPTLYEGINKLESRLKSKDRVFTIGDAAAITGYPLDESKNLLDQLMQKYDCRLKVTENGDLIYDFGSSLHPRGERTWAEWWHGFKKTLWKIFMVVFKVWISIMLVVYFIIFLLILIAIVIAMLSGNGNSDSSSSSSSSSSTDASGLFEFIGELFRSIFMWNTMTTRTYYDRDTYGYPYQRYESPRSPFDKINRRKKKKKGKNFVASVYDFVFGPPRVEPNPLENQKEVASYLRKNKGLVVMPEIVALAGWTAEQAEEFFTEVIVRYKGDSKISENRILYGDFFDLARTKTDQADAEIVWYWNEYVPEYQLTGNSTGRNFGVFFMNAFNLVFSSAAMYYALTDSEISYSTADFLPVFVFLGVIPFVFSALFFTVPILRWIQIGPLRRKRHRENIRKRLMKAIFKSSNAEITLNELLSTVNSSERGEEKLGKDTIEKIMQELIRDLRGEISLKEDATVVYTFHQLREELQEANHLRALRDSGQDLGNIVFDSHD